MKNLVLFSVLMLPIITYGQQKSFELPATDTDSFYVDRFDLVIDEEQGSFKVSNYSSSVLSGFVMLYEYAGALTDLAGVSITHSKDQKIIGLKLYACKETIDLTKIGFSDYIVKPPKKTSKIDIGSWDASKHHAEIDKIYKYLSKIIAKNNNCPYDADDQLHPMSQMFTFQENYSTGDSYIEMTEQMPVFNNSNSIDSRTNQVTTYLKSCLGSDTQIKVAQVDYFIDKDGSVKNASVIATSIYEKGKKPIDEALKWEKCLQDMQGWKAGTYKSDPCMIKLGHLIVLNDDNVKEALVKTFAQIKFMSERRVAERNGLNANLSQTQRDSIKHVQDSLFNESVLKSLDVRSDYLDDEIFVVVEQKPVPPQKDFDDFVEQEVETKAGNLKYRVVVKFVVEKDGSLSNINFMRSDNDQAAKLIEEILLSSKNWQPGKQRGQEKRVSYVLQLKN